VRACAAHHGTEFGAEGSGPGGDDGGAGSSSSSGGSGFGNLVGDGSSVGTVSAGPCKGGEYTGAFTGSYTSYLTGVGVPIPVTGNVDLTLDQEGDAGTQCKVDGEFQDCSSVFALQNRAITGVADGLFGYYCAMTGTLDCNKKKLSDGWIQCTYCTGPLAPGNKSCVAIGGRFAGPLTSDYDVNALAFVHGTWNGAEALAGNDGGSPGPEGGPPDSYLSDSGVYLGPNHFGGSGTWGATYGKDH
jgi:hypothetical protein